MGRRISKAVDNFDDWDQTYHYYYSGQQMVEMRDGSDQTIKQSDILRMHADTRAPCATAAGTLPMQTVPPYSRPDSVQRMGTS